jgi:hypothetical protein
MNHRISTVLFASSIALFFSHPSGAEEDDPGAKLPKSLQQEYMRSRLGVEVINQTTGGFYFNRQYGVGASTSATIRKWKGYRGFNTVSESDFYLAAGYEAEALQIKRWKTTGGVLAAVGAVAYTIGMSMMFKSLESTDEDQLYQGAGVAIGAAIPLGIGVFRLTNKKTSVGQASISAKQYNQRLADDLRAGRRGR